MPRFRPNTVDADCWRGIVDGNEYDLPEQLDPHALIVDIGTHVGSFVQACWNRGARNIVSFEASRENYELACENVGHLDGVRLFNAAVGRSDKHATDFVHFGGYVPFFDGRTNTGGGDVFANDGHEVPCIEFNDIEDGADIELLKIDCEGSEWPILYTSSLDRVKQITGEYHSLKPDVEKSLDLDRNANGTALAQFLSSSGFRDVLVMPPSAMHAQFHDGQEIGLFWAKR